MLKVKKKVLVLTKLVNTKFDLNKVNLCIGHEDNWFMLEG